jgi:hypothetical protein
MSSGAMDGMESIQVHVFHGFTTDPSTHPLLKCLISGAVDTGPISYPLIVIPTVHRMARVEVNAYIRAVFEPSSVGTGVFQRSTGIRVRRQESGVRHQESSRHHNPLIVWTTGQRKGQIDKNAYFQSSF